MDLLQTAAATAAVAEERAFIRLSQQNSHQRAAVRAVAEADRAAAKEAAKASANAAKEAKARVFRARRASVEAAAAAGAARESARTKPPSTATAAKAAAKKSLGIGIIEAARERHAAEAVDAARREAMAAYLHNKAEKAASTAEKAGVGLGVDPENDAPPPPRDVRCVRCGYVGLLCY